MRNLDGTISDKNVTEDALGLATRPVPQKLFRASFTKTLSGTVNTDLFDVIGTGAGQTINQTNGDLVITAGTTTRSETIIRSKETFSGALRLAHKIMLSQRNTNNNFIIELVDVIGDGLAYTINSATSITVTIPNNTFNSENIGQNITIGMFAGTGTFLSGNYPIASVSGNDVTFTVSGFGVGTGTCSLFGWNAYKQIYTSTTATSMLFSTQKDGRTAGNNASTILTTLTGHISVLLAENTLVTHLEKIIASSTTFQYSQRGNTSDNIIDSDVPLYLQIRSLNSTIAPTATTCTIGFVSVEDYVPQQVSLVSIQPQSVADGAPVRMINTSIPITGSIVANGGTSFPNPVVNLTGDTGAKTTTGNGATQTNNYTKGAQIVINIGAVTGTTPTAEFKLQNSSDSGTTWVDIPFATTGTITTSGAYGISVYPSIEKVAGTGVSGTTACASALLARTWRVVWTIGGVSPSFTITNIQVSSIL